jgi:hypothetical protein
MTTIAALAEHSPPNGRAVTAAREAVGGAVRVVPVVTVAAVVVAAVAVAGG